MGPRFAQYGGTRVLVAASGAPLMRSPCPSGHRRSLAVLSLPLLLVVGFLARLVPSVADSPRPGDAPTAKSPRAPWTTSRVVGSPDPPPPFKVVRAFPKLKFEHPLLLARCPGSDRLIVGDQAGVLYSFANRPDATADVFCDLRKEIRTIDLHPGAMALEA